MAPSQAIKIFALEDHTQGPHIKKECHNQIPVKTVMQLREKRLQNHCLKHEVCGMSELLNVTK